MGWRRKCSLIQSKAYSDEYGFNGIFLLPANLYGPRDNFHPDSSHVIPALIKKCVDAKEKGETSITAWGSGTATREFLFAADAAEGILLASEHYNSPEPVNLGTHQEISIKDLLGLIVDTVGFKGEIVWDSAQPDGQPRRCLDTTRAKGAFGFEATTPLKEGLQKTVDWYLRAREEGRVP